MANAPYGSYPGPTGPTGPRTGGPVSYPAAATDGALSRRLVAYLIDLFVIAVLLGLLWVAIAVLGVVTLSLGWGLFVLLPLTPFVYAAMTIGGRNQATIGMRVMGLYAMDASTGGRVHWIIAGAHALLFYVAAGTFLLWLVDLFIGFVRSDGRLGHDLLTNVVVVRAA